MCAIVGVAKQQTAASSAWPSPECVSKRVLQGGSSGCEFRHRPVRQDSAYAHRRLISQADGAPPETPRSGRAVDESA
jgi:hypothetical protein